MHFQKKKLLSLSSKEAFSEEEINMHDSVTVPATMLTTIDSGLTPS
jgi:hypothetical protein